MLSYVRFLEQNRQETDMKSIFIGAISGLMALLAVTAQAVSIGQSAPDFSLQNLAGETVKLSELRGKYVVLEWLNPECPFVKKHYDTGNMPMLQKNAKAEDVVWLAIASTHAKHQDYKSAAQLTQWLKDKQAQPTAVLLDQTGAVGRSYDAKTTPHMYIISPKGELLYAGAIDSKRSADPKDISSATNYVTQALGETMAGKPVSVASTQAYGCSIKYAD
jgi:alkyl hydroperoxide reductase subunit AhpC